MLLLVSKPSEASSYLTVKVGLNVWQEKLISWKYIMQKVATSVTGIISTTLSEVLFIWSYRDVIDYGKILYCSLSPCLIKINTLLIDTFFVKNA